MTPRLRWRAGCAGASRVVSPRLLPGNEWRPTACRSGQLAGAETLVRPHQTSANGDEHDAVRLDGRVGVQRDAVVVARADHHVAIEKDERAGWKVEIAGENKRLAEPVPGIVFSGDDRRIRRSTVDLRQHGCRKQNHQRRGRIPHRTLLAMCADCRSAAPIRQCRRRYAGSP